MLFAIPRISAGVAFYGVPFYGEKYWFAFKVYFASLEG